LIAASATKARVADPGRLDGDGLERRGPAERPQPLLVETGLAELDVLEAREAAECLERRPVQRVPAELDHGGVPQMHEAGPPDAGAAQDDVLQGGEPGQVFQCLVVEHRVAQTQLLELRQAGQPRQPRARERRRDRPGQAELGQLLQAGEVAKVGVLDPQALRAEALQRLHLPHLFEAGARERPAGDDEDLDVRPGQPGERGVGHAPAVDDLQPAQGRQAAEGVRPLPLQRVARMQLEFDDRAQSLQVTCQGGVVHRRVAADADGIHREAGGRQVIDALASADDLPLRPAQAHAAALPQHPLGGGTLLAR